MCQISLNLLVLCCWSAAQFVHASAGGAGKDILVLGSVNMDITIDVARLPLKGETTTSVTPTASLAVGGKGANQAIAAARLSSSDFNSSSSSSSSSHNTHVRFVGRFGADPHGATLQYELSAAGVDLSGCSVVPGHLSGQGIVMLEPDGAASSIVVGGANTAWGKGAVLEASALSGVGVLLLQREVPEAVNLAAALAAADAGVPVMMDAGGTDRALPLALLPLLSYLCPNELELQALTGKPTDTQEQVIAAARGLIQSGVSSVLVTLSERGAVLVDQEGNVTTQQALPVPGGAVVDGTAAGDAFRAGFAVGLVKGWPLQQSLQFAAAAGALAVSRKGALPSLPTLGEVVAHLQEHADLVDPELLTQLETTISSSSRSCSATSPDTCTSPGAASTPSPPGTPPLMSGGVIVKPVNETCPFNCKFASRLNSMQARRDLVDKNDSSLSNDVLGWIARQGRVQGLDLVDLNYPQHFEEMKTSKVQEAVQAAGLHVGAINIRFPERFLSGAFTNPDPDLRAAAVQLAADGCRMAAELGADHVVVWSPYDGYDHYLQMDYNMAWLRTVQAYRELASRCAPDVRVSAEFKPTDPSTRFSIVPNTAAACLLALSVARPNFGLTLDIGHVLLAGENPAQAIAMVARMGWLFGVHLNDAHVRLGAEDGLPFGSVNPLMALEVVFQLQRSMYTGHIYFDTFPTTMDPVKEAEWNVRNFKALWLKSLTLLNSLADVSKGHDALGVLQLLLQETEDQLSQLGGLRPSQQLQQWLQENEDQAPRQHAGSNSAW